MKKILGLDLGTNSIGWALIKSDFEKKEGEIIGMGSRIIPIGQDVIGNFDGGGSISRTGDRTKFRSIRRLYERNKLRRERLHRVLHILGFLPDHFTRAIDFEVHPGQFKDGQETKINYEPIDAAGNHRFIFMESFQEMISDFQQNGHLAKIPYDWTLYYLRKKALTEPVSKQELAWIILNFNQKRGYYQLRGEEEEEEDRSKAEEYHELKVVRVEKSDRSDSKGTWYHVHLENGWIYKRQSKDTLDNWVGTQKEFIVTTFLDESGSPKTNEDGEIKRSFRAPKEEEWKLVKKKTEHFLEDFNRRNGTSGVATYIYHELLKNPKTKIRGKLIRTIERKFYKNELKDILQKQKEFHPELSSKEKLQACAEDLYRNNEAKRAELMRMDIPYILLEDILFYQRPLKSKKSTIGQCQFEYRTYRDAEGNFCYDYKKAAPKSHPLYQEFRIWQFIRNLRIYQCAEERQGIQLGFKDVTDTLLITEDDWTNLYDFIARNGTIEQKDLIRYLLDHKLISNKGKSGYRWNYVEDKSYPAGETRAQLLTKLQLIEGIDPNAFLTAERELQLWHIIYSVKDKNEYLKALGTFARKNGIDEDSFIRSFQKLRPFENEYGSLSLKALKRILPLMRQGKYWEEKAIPAEVAKKVNQAIGILKALNFNKERLEEYRNDAEVARPILKSFLGFQDKNPLCGLNTYQACYVIYGRHSEGVDNETWKTPESIESYLKSFRQHSLRNPIVEQVVTETLRVVRDIWIEYGKGEESFFDEIHIELGREMKNPKDKRAQIAKQNIENQTTNFRIRKILEELHQESQNKDLVRPNSPSQQEILKIYEEGVIQSIEKIDGDIERIRKNPNPSKSDIVRYKLWLDQKYYSPYTGKIIPLSRLFTREYEIEHIIPQSRYFDDSLGNKVICESAINQLKDNDIAYDFIKSKGGQVVDLGNGSIVKVYNLEEYKEHCARFFRNNRVKLKNLLTEEVPEGFLQRQLTDTRYISKFIKGLLSNIVKEQGEQEATSKHIVTVTGSITSRMKQDWGLNDKWNDLILPRFKRLNDLSGTMNYALYDRKINTYRIQVPDEIARGFSKKRIDHRHHALDALVVACITKDHVNYLTSMNTLRTNQALVSKLRKVEYREVVNRETGEIRKIRTPEEFLLPWASFPADAAEMLEGIIVSFKQNQRIISKNSNHYWSYHDEDGKLRLDKDGNPKKALTTQRKGNRWAIRQSLHKASYSGLVTLRRKKETPISLSKALEIPELIVDRDVRKIVVEGHRQYPNDIKRLRKHFKENPIILKGEQIDMVEVYHTYEATAKREELLSNLTRKQLESITDTGIQKILENHLKNYKDENEKERFDLAFSPEGIEEMNRRIQELNDGKPHQPIRSVRLSEVGSKFPVGSKGNKKTKYVEADKGTNLFFAVYWNEEKQKREYETIPLKEVIEHQKQTAHLPLAERTPIQPNPEKGRLLFTLSPNDLVYMPSEEEKENPKLFNTRYLNKEQTSRIYKMVSSNLYQCFFIQNNVANPINTSNVFEFSSANKMEKDLNGLMIKNDCWKIEINRLGQIKRIVGYD
ncbi:MAG: type II CRISPR RNA-guided endonuclease Cas9 [Lentimicrobiaceae bacterium]|nr:type II CRISPR RNA-guided endonuclease Cas9 [Lentimicrobiaceae bacterium]